MSTTTRTAALITGAAAGIGRATALRLAQDGWHCVLVDADAAALQRLQQAWPAGHPAPLALVADLTDAARIAQLAHEVPPLDALINNAGMSAGGMDALDEGKSARLLALNLQAPARVVQACTAQLKPGARVVNLASGAGLRAIPWRGLYSPSKAGLIAQTQALAQARPEWTVTALSPGFVRTELVQGLIDMGRLDPVQATGKIPLGRMADPDDMAHALSFLASEGARPLTGQVLVVDGGSSVVGGSQPLPPAEFASLPLDAMPYPAVVDDTARRATTGGVMDAVLAAARAFRARHDRQASLTLLLPAPGPATAWQLAGDLGAAHMLVATLAAEWGARGLRINALQLQPGAPLDALQPLIGYIASARAQFLTGQVLTPGA